MYIIMLNINDCEINKHSGNYLIQAKNEGGESFCSFQLNVSYNPNIIKKKSIPREKEKYFYANYY